MMNKAIAKAPFDSNKTFAPIKAVINPQHYVECGQCGAIKVDAMELARALTVGNIQTDFPDGCSLDDAIADLLRGITADSPVELNDEAFAKWYDENEKRICKFNDPDECGEYVKYSEVVLCADPCDCFHQATIPSIA